MTPKHVPTLDLLAQITRDRAALDQSYGELIVKARAEGFSYGEIGKAAGISRQAARQRVEEHLLRTDYFDA